MLLREFKNPETHIEESEAASRALALFRREFGSYPDFQKSYVIESDKIGDQYPVFYLFFDKRGVDDGEDTLGYVTRHNPMVIGIYFWMPQDYDKAKRYVASSNFESIFRHEYQHFYDELTTTYKWQKFKNKDEYINSDVEYSAWFKQLAEPLLAILRAAKAGEDLSRFPKIEPEFGQFIRGGQHFKMRDYAAPLGKFSPKYKKRYLRELAAIHKAVVAIEGQTGTFKPKALGRLFLWIHSKTGLTV